MSRDSAAMTLDALNEWISDQMTMLLRRHSTSEDAFFEASVASRFEALKAYRSSRSAEQSLSVGKRAFKSEVRAHLAPNAPRLSEWDFPERSRSSQVGGVAL